MPLLPVVLVVVVALVGWGVLNATTWSIVPVGLAGQRASMAALIQDEFRRAGMPDAFGVAAVANAMRESGLNPDAFNPELEASSPGRGSVGLFQLYDNGNGIGAGVGMSRPLVEGRPHPDDLRLDPTANTRRIIAEVRSSWGDAMRSELEQGATVARLAALFARDIERPARVDVAMRRSRELTAEMFPTLLDVAGSDLGMS